MVSGIRILVGFLLTLFPIICNAIDCNFYMKLESGMVFAKKLQSIDHIDKPNNSPIFGGGIGKKINDHLDIEFLYYHNTAKFLETIGNTTYSQKFITNSSFINANFNLFKYGEIVPYLTMGMGLSNNTAGTYKAIGRIQGMRPSKTQNYSVFNLGGGVKASITPNMDVSVGYKYFDLGKAKTSTAGIVETIGTISSPVIAKLNNHVILTGINFHF